MAPRPSGFTISQGGYYKDSDNSGPYVWDGTNMILQAGAGSLGALPAGADRSGSITAGGAAQQLAGANANRTALTGQNISAGDLWINETGGTAAVDGAGSYKVGAGQTFSIATNRAISIAGATAGQKWTATEV